MHLLKRVNVSEVKKGQFPSLKDLNVCQIAVRRSKDYIAFHSFDFDTTSQPSTILFCFEFYVKIGQD